MYQHSAFRELHVWSLTLIQAEIWNDPNYHHGFVNKLYCLQGLCKENVPDLAKVHLLGLLQEYGDVLIPTPTRYVKNSLNQINVDSIMQAYKNKLYACRIVALPSLSYTIL